MPNTWTTEEQNEWFADKREAFLAAQKAGKVSAFFTETEGQFFERWPELTRLFGPDVALSTLTAEQEVAYRDALVARKKRIHAKFYNLHSKLKKGEANGVSLTSLLSASGKGAGTRCPQELEVYMKLYYKDKIQPGVEAEIKENNVPSSKTIGVIRRHTQLAYDDETEEVKAEVRAKLSELKGAAAAAAAKQSSAANAGLSPAEYQRTINALPRIGQEVTRTLCLNSGWSAFLVIGGPCPEEGGALKTMAFFDGQTVAGHTFKQAYMGYEENIIDPWNAFLKAVYPREERLRRALTSTPEPESSGPSVATAPPPSTAPQPVVRPVDEEDRARHNVASPQAEDTGGSIEVGEEAGPSGAEEIDPPAAEEAGPSGAEEIGPPTAEEVGPSLIEDAAASSLTFGGASEDRARTAPDASPLQPALTYDAGSSTRNVPYTSYGNDADLLGLLPSNIPGVSAPFNFDGPLTTSDATRFLIDGPPHPLSSGSAIGQPSLLDMLNENNPFPNLEGTGFSSTQTDAAGFGYSPSAPSYVPDFDPSLLPDLDPLLLPDLDPSLLPDLDPSLLPDPSLFPDLNTSLPFAGVSSSSLGDPASAMTRPTTQASPWWPQAVEVATLSANRSATSSASEPTMPPGNKPATSSSNATTIRASQSVDPLPAVHSGLSPTETTSLVGQAATADVAGHQSGLSPASTHLVSQQPTRVPLSRVDDGGNCPSTTPDAEHGRPRRERHAPKPRDADWILTATRSRAKENEQVMDAPAKQKKRGATDTATPRAKRRKT
ncbi:uncharacterized protein C8Q71DRAFT_861684 [Rhodofomes roseus]|uniref:Uncharacterized protein n=1 Tax=Rhodofomes roseus TaxID=34475 RepID=A0ABQ8K449_9APHY|nr:uncharacterized protein C8Q71DRAFT_861684 [Rhodofomes roseus]KAH9831678.1 hypothetical protein C8Q71DRAFT_861684 [Rhodofomes roseus]